MATAPDRLWCVDATYVATWAGWLYLAVAERCREAGTRPSTGSTGDCFDNTLAESFVATLECEWLKRRTLRSKAEGERALFQLIEGW